MTSCWKPAFGIRYSPDPIEGASDRAMRLGDGNLARLPLFTLRTLLMWVRLALKKL
jgi:hypothetical protein